MSAQDNLSPYQFYHGTNDEHQPGDLIDPSQPHPRVHNISLHNQVYFTTDIERGRFYADYARKNRGGQPHVYGVEPTGEYHQDVQTLRVPENKTSRHPLRIVGEV